MKQMPFIEFKNEAECEMGHKEHDPKDVSDLTILILCFLQSMYFYLVLEKYRFITEHVMKQIVIFN